MVFIWLVGYKEVVNLACNKLGRCWLTCDDVNYVFPIEASAFTEEGFNTVIMILMVEYEFTVIKPVWVSWYRLRLRPAGESSCALFHIILGVIANPHTKKLKKFPSKVFVRGVCMVHLLVKPVDHGRIFRQL